MALCYHGAVAQRRHHYEVAFEQYLRERRVPYVAVDEARKALLPEDARLLVTEPGLGQRSLKSFDFVLYGRDSNLLVEIKGRKIARRRAREAGNKDGSHGSPRRLSDLPAGEGVGDGERGRRRTSRGTRPTPAPARLENWVTEEDVESLTTWERLFGEGFAAAFVFVYWCDELPPLALFEEVYECRGRWYALRAVALSAYAAQMRPRSTRWRTVHVPPLVFDRISTCLCGPTGTDPGPDPPQPGLPFPRGSGLLADAAAREGGATASLPCRPALVASGV